MNILVVVLALFCMCVAQPQPDDLQQAHGGWSAPLDYHLLWNKLRDAVTPEAERYVSGLKAEEAALKSDTETEALLQLNSDSFSQLFGRQSDGNVGTAFQILQTIVEQTLSTITDGSPDTGYLMNMLRNVLVEDIQYTNHADPSQPLCIGILDATDCILQERVAAIMQCKHLACVSWTYTTDIISADSPIVVVRSIETMISSSGHKQRTLHQYNIIVRPRFDDTTAPLSYSRIAVMEHLQTSLRGDYDPPMELVNQAKVVRDYAAKYTAYWKYMHQKAEAEEQKRLLDDKKHGIINVDIWRRRALDWCERNYVSAHQKRANDMCRYADELGTKKKIKRNLN